MSVILDALRKLDREKSSRRKGTANIAAEILRPDLTRPRRRMPIFIVTAVAVAVAAAAVTYGVMFKFGFPPKPSPPATKAMLAPSQQVAPGSRESGTQSKLSSPTPASPPVAGEQVSPSPSESRLSPPASVNPSAAIKQIPAHVPRVPVREAQEELGRIPPKTQSPVEKKDRADVKIPVESKNPAAPVIDKKSSQDVIPKAVDIVPKKTSEPTPNISAADPASLKVSAIVWYEDPSRRFAMINGIMATEGSYVEGIKVVEINPTSVRLLHNGQYFEISMSK